MLAEDLFLLGVYLALASAATFGLNNAALRRGVLTGSVLHAMAITVPLGVPLFALACLPFGGIEAIAKFTVPGWLWMALAGVVHFVIGRYGNYRATRAIGAALTAPIQQLSVPVSLVLAIGLLDEVLTPLKIAGLVLVMAGPAIALRRGRAPDAAGMGSTFHPSYGEGVIWASVSALAYGASPLFIMKGLGPNGALIDSLAGGLISYSSAAVVVTVLVLLVGGKSYMQPLDPTAGKWFLASGIFVFVSQMFRYMSLALAPVSVVVPLQRLSVVFRVIFSWILNRDHEALGIGVLVGIAISVIGVLALTVSPDLVASLIGAEWAEILTAEWP